MKSRKYFWIILAVCILSAGATLLQLFAVYVMSAVELPGMHARLQSLIAGASDIGRLKSACLSLARFDESEQQGRINFLLYVPVIALATSLVCAAVAGTALVATRKSKRGGVGEQ